MLCSGVGSTLPPQEMPSTSKRSYLRARTARATGDDDPIVPRANAAIFDALLPRVRVECYSGGPLHLLTDTEKFAPIVDGFLDQALPEADVDAVAWLAL